MKKTMVKRIFVFLTVTLTVTAAVFANSDFIKESLSAVKEIIEEKDDPLLQEELCPPFGDDAESGMTALFNSLRENGCYYDEIKMFLCAYNEIAVNYPLNVSENEMLMEKSYLGKDFGKILKIYEFLQMTDSGVQALTEIYDILQQDGVDSIELAYAIYTNTVDDELSISEVAHYVDNGLTVQDIASMYEITLKGSKKLREALDERLSGKEWGDIVSEAYSLPPGIFGEKAAPLDIAGIKSISEKLSVPVEDIVSLDENGRLYADKEIMNEYLDKQRQINEFNASIGKFENLDILIDSETEEKLSFLTKEEIANLREQGFSLRDAEDAEAAGRLITFGKTAVIR